MKLSEKVIVITGASKGLGNELAIQLSRQCRNLILLAKSYDLLLILQKQISQFSGVKVEVIKCDVSDYTEVKAMAEKIKEKYKRIDVLVNNAGIGIHKISEDVSIEEMQKQFDVNYFGTFYCIKELLPLLKLSPCGYILNVGSLTSFVPYADNSVYASTKSALKTFTKGIRQEFRKYNIKAGIIQTGIINTNFQDDRINNLPGILILKVQNVASVIIKMILKRKETLYMYRWMIWIMRMRLIFK
ncbi:MAG: SDR family NAD(P)-dependent oxidoreductase [Bacteroidales bacterium]|nr:SDR family NAD(P)-dependent oxidoreductase [Bacteroidales bacterium]